MKREYEDYISDGWDYSQTSKLMKDNGGPVEFLNGVHNDGFKEGIIVSIASLIAAGCIGLITKFILNKKNKNKYNDLIIKVKDKDDNNQ